MTNYHDVIIVGAGFSGLAAGLKLKEAGLNVCILESRQRVGGRTETSIWNKSYQIDLGGQWLGPTQNRMYELVEEYDLETFPTQLFGKSCYKYFGGNYDKEPEEMTRVYNKLDDLAQEIDLDNPLESPNISQQDRITFYSWLKEQVEDKELVKFLGRILAGGLLASDAGEISLFQMLYYIKAGHGVNSLLSAKGGAQQDRVLGGPQAIANKLAEALGEALKLNQEVSAVEKVTKKAYVVKTKQGEKYVAPFVLISVPPVVVNRNIQFIPELPYHKRRMLQSIVPGNALKFHAIYSRPFWREYGLSGQTNKSNGWIMESVDNSLPQMEKGILTFFVYGDDACEWKTLHENIREKVLIDELVDLFGEKAREVEELISHDWGEEAYTGGCFSGHFFPGCFLKYGQYLREPVGNIHWTGTETATDWNGYFEGAVQSGEREAEKIIKKWKSNQ